MPKDCKVNVIVNFPEGVWPLYGASAQRHKLTCRWWLKIRPCKTAVPVNVGHGVSACLEFYIPFSAWPFELLHRCVFGKAKLLQT